MMAPSRTSDWKIYAHNNVSSLILGILRTVQGHILSAFESNSNELNKHSRNLGAMLPDWARSFTQSGNAVWESFHKQTHIHTHTY